MSVIKILEDNWSEYDNKKKKGEDSHFFACTEAWEVDYLVNKINKYHANIPLTTIRLAISTCCKTVGSPHPRKKFVECVAARLGIPV